jgi:hypothetical protein
MSDSTAPAHDLIPSAFTTQHYAVENNTPTTHLYTTQHLRSGENTLKLKYNYLYNPALAVEKTSVEGVERERRQCIYTLYPYKAPQARGHVRCADVALTLTSAASAPTSCPRPVVIMQVRYFASLSVRF